MMGTAPNWFRLAFKFFRWIANYHEHETLLQENEEEKLSKEEQDMAWENFKRGTIQWEEVQRVSFDNSAQLKTATPETTFEGSALERKPVASVGSTVPESSRGTMQWEEVQRVSYDNSTLEQRKIVANVGYTVSESRLAQLTSASRNNSAQRKCTNLSHKLTLRSQGTKPGCSTVCGECAQVISLEALNRNGKSPR
ncbi:hypothetical protein IFM89_038920 [Coptis chinensis]|uniref:Uncharacterized protein n=1 Tax=Coptis chinensis TaxID=261450 RepID=A0A835I8W7_9MAGN|nr:hypothetical protein IFM89_038920 [Coptis chinensis]